MLLTLEELYVEDLCDNIGRHNIRVDINAVFVLKLF